MHTSSPASVASGGNKMLVSIEIIGGAARESILHRPWLFGLCRAASFPGNDRRVNCYLFTSEPAGAVYAELIQFCCQRADTMILVRQDAAAARSLELRQVFAKLSAFQIKAALSTQWPGTTLFASQALVYRYRVDEALGALLLGISSALFDWSHEREYPEDLSFLRANGKPLLVNTVHERDACLYLTDAELPQFQDTHPALMEILRFEGKTP